MLAPAAATQVDADPGRTGMSDEEQSLFAEAAAIHFASVANQSRAVVARDAGDTKTADFYWRRCVAALEEHPLAASLKAMVLAYRFEELLKLMDESGMDHE